jgi:two-component system phosphate regulon sensor histidine kinase PhoR
MIIGPSDVFLQARGSTLRDTRDNVLGALIVLNDVTRLKTLENIRRDFVANVSHELKTPITSIKGFLETLREGAWDDRENAERFMDIMLKHTNRLDAIIDDLLSLSRIERDTERGEVILDIDSVRDVLDLVVKEAKEKAKDKNMTVDFRAPDELVARINPSLLEQALMNLVENSIKYSDPGKTISISADYSQNEIVIRVKDQGYGISQEHLSRIFERFYRVDKARDRKIGGTGLGLAIVKHIVHAHGGRIGVESSPGKGSTFSIFLPAGSESAHPTLRK